MVAEQTVARARELGLEVLMLPPGTTWTIPIHCASAAELAGGASATEVVPFGAPATSALLAWSTWPNGRACAATGARVMRWHGRLALWGVALAALTVGGAALHETDQLGIG